MTRGRLPCTHEQGVAMVLIVVYHNRKNNQHIKKILGVGFNKSLFNEHGFAYLKRLDKRDGYIMILKIFCFFTKRWLLFVRV